MESVNVEGIIDKLADKLNVAVDQITPLAQTTLDQYVHKSLFWSIGCAILLVVCILLSIIFIPKAHKAYKLRHDAWAAYSYRDLRDPSVHEIAFYIIGIGSLPFCFILLGMLCVHLTNYIAPLPSLLGL